MAFSLPKDEIFAIYNEVADYMIDELFTTDCSIVYPPLEVECENCYFNTMPGVGATNRYRPGGPYPFEDGVCPYCNGAGHRFTTTSQSIKIRAYYDLKTWVKFNQKLAYKAGSAVIIGYMTDVPKFQHMAYIQLDTNLSGYNNYRFELTCDPFPWGFKGDRYFTANIGRVNGES